MSVILLCYKDLSANYTVAARAGQRGGAAPKQRGRQGAPRETGSPRTPGTASGRASGSAAAAAQLQVQFLQLLGIDDCRRTRHQVDRIRGLGERNHLANGRFPRQQRDDAVEPKSDAPVR